MRVEARPVVFFALFAAFIGAVAVAAPQPWYDTDRGTYEAIGRQFFVIDCSDLHCFRPLVAWTLEHLPGPSIVKWKAYAVLANAAAAIALARFCTILGLSERASLLAALLVATGFGPMYTVFDCYTSDPLMFLLAPLLMADVVIGRERRAGLLGAVGVLAKEFAAAPLWIGTIWSGLRREWARAFRLFTIALTVTLVWVVVQLWLTIGFNYSYGGSASVNLLGGGYLRHWFSLIGARGAAVAVFSEFGALYLLLPFGLLRARSDLRRLALAALPAAALLAYVQQPDRALWNFHFIVIPAAVLVLEQLPAWASGAFVACYAAANLRVGAQLQWIPAARLSLLLSIVIAAGAIVVSMRRRIDVPPPPGVACSA